MVRVYETKRIFVPKRAVLAFVKNPKNDTKWIGGVKKTTILTKLPIKKGSRILREARFLGKKISYEMKIIELSQSKIVMETVSSPFPTVITYTFEPIDDGTKVGIDVAGDSKGYYRLSDAVMLFSIRKNLRQDLKKLKKLLE